MATGALLPSGYETLEDNNGASVPGGLIWTYAAGTVTPLVTYSDANLTVPNTNPIIADGAGRWTAYAAPGSAYKLVMETPAVPPTHGATIKTVDNLTGPAFTGQLQFPAVQVPSSDPNTLDDYEEGTWVPVDASGAGVAFGSPVGVYVKVGQMVCASGSVLIPVTAAPQTVMIGGFPFVFSVALSAQGGCFGYTNQGGALNTLLGGNAAVSISIYATTGVGVTYATFSNRQLTWSITYRCTQ